jgi:DNA-binding transcriptional regulator YbjK
LDFAQSQRLPHQMMNALAFRLNAQYGQAINPASIGQLAALGVKQSPIQLNRPKAIDGDTSKHLGCAFDGITKIIITMRHKNSKSSIKQDKRLAARQNEQTAYKFK